MRGILLSLWVVLFCCHYSHLLEIKKITAVEGGTAILPCNFQHPRDDAVFLILWFNGNLTTPIYSYDMRPGAQGAHWVDETVLGTRASLDVASSPARLRLTDIKAADAGLYKCRVDFRRQPTKTTRVSLAVIVPPTGVSVLSEGRPVTSVVGPYREGETASLTCLAHGGSPPPHIQWFVGDLLLDDQMDEESQFQLGNSNTLLQGPASQTILANTLTLGPFKRSDLKKLVTCEVSNTNLTNPLSAAVMIDMNLKPLSVQLLGPEDPLSADKDYDLVCDVRGSRPPPTITWWKGTTRVQGARETTTNDGNMTTSTLTLTPRPPDDGTKVTCRAKNPATDTVIEKALPLVVHYVPEAVISLGSSLNPESIKEKDDVYFECSIQANPRAYKVTWQHNGRPLQHNITSGIIVSNQSLVLQRVTRRHAGDYSCTASNIEGDGISNLIKLDIKYAPVCAPGQVTTYGVARLEDAEVTCRVAANPEAQGFKWTFNNTADTIDVPPGRFTTASTFSIITYTPMTELDYGTLLCWAKNAIGKQVRPCVFHIVPAGKPDPPANCTVTNQTSTSFSVACQAGFDGGLRQLFVLRVARPGTQGHNHTAGQPVFQVSQLQPDTTYRLQIWAVNDKGASPFVHYAGLHHTPAHTHGSTFEREQGIACLCPFPTYSGNAINISTVVAEVREETGTDGGGVSTGGVRVRQQRRSLLPEDVGDVPILVSAVVGASVGIVLLLLLPGTLLRQRVRRPQPPPTPQASHSVQVKSPVPILETETHTCPEREMQVESESDVDPDLIPQQLPNSALSPSGPLLRPPANYGGGDTSFCEVVPHGVVGGGGVLGGPRGVHHQLLPAYPHQPAVSTSTSTPHHHHSHLLPQPQHAYQHDPTNDPRYAHLDLEHGSHHDAAAAAQRSRVVPTVYATLDTRHAHSRAHVTFDLRQAHSQASLDMTRSHELPSCSQRGRALSRDLTPHTHESTTHDLSYGHQRSQPHDSGRPLLDEDATPDTPLVGKRESSV
ncbi:nephrin-like [Penaeus japonicus]|uniref:nephrin-like n=1 Tax=Penaeus japonicus TaxID=27405 RepID=UPI001C715889|nr:nephrin-like [Penaeus japonicus]